VPDRRFDHETVFSITYDTAERARRVERAVAPEVRGIDDERSQTELDRQAAELVVTVEARDLVALRAAQNTWLSLLSVAEQAGDVC
jgi:KEOPS complex subunit Pcc1